MKKILCGIAALIACGLWLRASDEVTVSGGVTVNNQNFKYTRSISALQVDQASSAADMGIFNVTALYPTNAVNLPTYNVTVPGYCFFGNAQTNLNTLFISNVVIRLDPGTFAILPIEHTNIVVYATNSAQKLEYWINQR